MLRTALLCFITALLLVRTDLITVVRIEGCPDEQLPQLIGFPLAYRTSIPWVNSMSGVLYVQGLLVDVLFWTLLALAISVAMERLLPAHVRRARAAHVLAWVYLCGATLAVLFLFGVIEWQMQWAPHAFQCPQWSWAMGAFPLAVGSDHRFGIGTGPVSPTGGGKADVTRTHVDDDAAVGHGEGRMIASKMGVAE